MNNNEKYINRCLELAHYGLAAAIPNPSVGAVIVLNDKIIGEGYTAAYGGPHAEVNAINAVHDKSLLKQSTIYVSLEPCSHFGKTPPCSDLIIKYGISHVVIGTLDPNVKVSGNGIKKLIDAGLKVTVGVLEKKCRSLNKKFFTYHEKKRPYIILKWAESQDGFMTTSEKQRKLINGDERKPIWITNIFSRQLVHKWRSEVQSILVGTQTVVDDNPKLDVRDWVGTNPVKIVLDQNNRISKESHIFDSQVQTFILSKNDINFNKNVAAQIVNILFQRNIQSVLIEGGKQTLQTFIDEQLWDEARVFKSKLNFNEGLKAPIINSENNYIKHILTDELLIFENND